MTTQGADAPAQASPLGFDSRANPVWVRELKQSARLTRTPFVLATVTALTALIICSVGGIASTNAAPAEVGVATFHTFFSLAFAVISWVGPGVAAMTIASERSGRTWEALLLTGLGVRTIARGKFLAALTYIGLYLVILIPVGALPFLFGGVTATEVVTAFLLLALFSALAVGFGLSISSALNSPGLAAVVTLPIAVALSIAAYTSFGIGGSFVAHEIWPSVPQGAPVWLPTAYVRATFGAEYLAYLCLIPIGGIALAAWFFYETTVANMMGPTDDRASGLKRWNVVTVPLLTLMALCPLVLADDHYWQITVGGVVVLFFLGVLSLFLFAGDALEPSRRVLLHWERAGAGLWTRVMGPGIVKTSLIVVFVYAIAMLVLCAVGFYLEHAGPTPPTDAVASSLAAVAGYAIAFLVFLSGVVVVSRAGTATGAFARLMLLLATFGALAGPWFALAISGVFGRSFEAYLAIASPSPIYVAVVIAELNSLTPNHPSVATAAVVCIVLWATAGTGLLLVGARRVALRSAAAAEARRALDERLERETFAAESENRSASPP